MKRTTAGLCLLAFINVSCARPVPKAEPVADPKVIVGSPRYEEVTDYEEFTGRTEAVQNVELRSRVSGYLEQVHFADGAKVNKGDLLFSMDALLYQAEFERADANVKLAEARLARLQRDVVRAKRLRDSSSISEEEFDRFSSDAAEGEAAVKVAAASRRTAEQNLKYTKVYAPISGVMSRRLVDPGNLVKADDTMLSVLVVTNPMFINFDIDDRTLLAIRRGVFSKEIAFDADRQTSIDIALPDEDNYSLTAKINFIDNKLDAGTGTIRLRADVANPNGILTPGLFVRVRLPIGAKTKQLLVPEVAVSTDQGLKFIYAVNDANEVVRRRITKLGKTFGRERVLLESEVQSSDRIIIEGQQRARPGAKVKPELPKPAPQSTTSAG